MGGWAGGGGELYVVGGDMGSGSLIFPTIYLCSGQCVVLIMSQGSAVAVPASGRDRQHGQSATNGKAKDNGGKARDKDGQTYFKDAHNSVFL